MTGGLFRDTLSPELLYITSTNEGVVPPHMAVRLNTNITDINKTTQENKYS